MIEIIKGILRIRKLLRLEENVCLDVQAGNFELDAPEVDKEFYMDYYQLKWEDING